MGELERTTGLFELGVKTPSLAGQLCIGNNYFPVKAGFPS